MAPHDTNTEKEARRHSVPLVGMGVLVALVLVGFVWWLSRETDGEGETAAPPSFEQEAPAPAN